MKISVVTTLFKSERYIVPFLTELGNVLSSMSSTRPDMEFEVIIVNDGSPDNSFQLASNFARSSRVGSYKLVDLSRNFGHHYAIMAGIEQTLGDYVYVIDCDLEEPIQSIPDFWNEIQAHKNIDLVYGVVKTRKGGLVKRLGGAIYYWLFNKISDISIPKNVTHMRVMTRRFVNALLKYKERQVVFVGLCTLTGFNQIPLQIDKSSRKDTSYSFCKRFALGISNIVALTSRPLYLVFWSGIIITLASIIIVVRVLTHKYVWGTPIDGWTSIMLSIWLVGGILIFCVGLIGIYLSKIFVEVKARPNVIIQEIKEIKEIGGNS